MIPKDVPPLEIWEDTQLDTIFKTKGSALASYKLCLTGLNQY
jgi:hypothetical protein